ncbi:Uncharacterised protein [Mycobacterium tuberculosis]|nr:Uncharacterised protein [Mycobacterium tuberculosis]
MRPATAARPPAPARAPASRPTPARAARQAAPAPTVHAAQRPEAAPAPASRRSPAEAAPHVLRLAAAAPASASRPDHPAAHHATAAAAASAPASHPSPAWAALRAVAVARVRVRRAHSAAAQDAVALAVRLPGAVLAPAFRSNPAGSASGEVSPVAAGLVVECLLRRAVGGLAVARVVQRLGAVGGRVSRPSLAGCGLRGVRAVAVARVLACWVCPGTLRLAGVGSVLVFRSRPRRTGVWRACPGMGVGPIRLSVGSASPGVTFPVRGPVASAGRWGGASGERARRSGAARVPLAYQGAVWAVSAGCSGAARRPRALARLAAVRPRPAGRAVA